jgi:thymidylate synthase (FAD)
MNVNLIYSTPDAEIVIGRAAAVCYEGDTTDAACLRRASHCTKRGHLSVLRFAYATFHISEISRVCSHQMVRVAHAGILQRSQRFVKETGIKFVHPPSIPVGFGDHWEAIEVGASSLYEALIIAGMPKEDARYILPQGCWTELKICMNFQAWRDFLKNRTHQAAQWEIRAVAEEIERQLHGIAPGIF